MAKIEKLGSLYFGGLPQKVGVAYNGEQISFGDATPGQEISWVRMQSGLLIASRCVCTNISWEDLDKEGFVFGTLVTINGETYLCHCLKVGAKEGETNEWDAALDETGEGNDLWHWKNKYFWGQETSEQGASLERGALLRAVRGCPSARFWYHYGASYRSVYLGFRPALEYLGSVSYSPDTLVGKAIKAYFPGGVSIEGHLVDFSDYDIVLRPSTQLSANFPWVMNDNCNIVVSRGNIIWLKEA